MPKAGKPGTIYNANDIGSKSISISDRKDFFEKYTKDKMQLKYKEGFKYMRIYPEGKNVESKNYNPVPYLLEGA